MIRRFLKFLVFTIFILHSSFCYSWFDAGHMVIAQIAYDRLDKLEKAEVDRLILVLKDAEPRYKGFVKAATWMDGIKGTGISFYDTFHYINQYYSVHPVKNMPSFNECNVVWTIERAVKTLKHQNSSDYSKALALRFLIHMVGDVHQPMHCTSRISESTPKGDRGGNDFLIQKIPFGRYKGKPATLSNLHQLWDSGVTFFAGIETDDYPAEKDKIDKNVEDIENYVSSLKRSERQSIINRVNRVSEPSEWALESYHLAVKFAYSDIKERGRVSKGYTIRGQEIVKVQAYVAGSRLARILKEIF